MKEISNKYKNIREYTLQLCEPLMVEDFTPQSAPFASPPKWHIAHTTWFFEEMILKQYVKDYKAFDKDYSFLFNSYYNTLGKRIERHQRGLITRPSVEEIYKYRNYVDEQMMILLSTNNYPNVLELVTLGLQHEQQHQELLLTDIKYTFSKNPTYPVYKNENFISQKNEDSGWVAIEEGIYQIGYNSQDFCFDNELGHHRVFLEPFSISKSLVTNQEFIEFIEDGGYENPLNWLDDGWYWIQKNNIKKPLYWCKKDDEWCQYTLSGIHKIDYDDILSHISFYEAAAFAAWKNMRLLTEFEWEVASEQFNWGKRWEWTNSAYLPYPNFKIKEGVVGEYNGKFMINTMVLRGASAATFKNHSRKTYRNFFSPETQWQFSGIRLAK